MGSCKLLIVFGFYVCVVLIRCLVDFDKFEIFYDFMLDLFDIFYIDQSYLKGDYFNDIFEISGVIVKNLIMGFGFQMDLVYGLFGVGYVINEVFIGFVGFMYFNLLIFMQQSGFIRIIVYSFWLNDFGVSMGNIFFGGIDMGKFLGEMMCISVFKDKKVDVYIYFVILMILLEVISLMGIDILVSDWFIEVIFDLGIIFSYFLFDFVKFVWDEVGVMYNLRLEMVVLLCFYVEYLGYFFFGFVGQDGF